MASDRMGSSRQNNSSAAPNYKAQALLNHYAQAGQGHIGAQYLHRGLPAMSPHVGEANMHTLASGMGAMNIHPPYGSAAAKSGSQLSAASSEYAGLPMTQAPGLWVPNQALVSNMYPVMHGASQQPSAMAATPAMYNHVGQFVPPAAYQYGPGMMENSPMAPAWASRVSSNEVPSLISPRRDSISSNENDVPGTPYTGNGVYRYGPATAIMDRSPSAVYTNSATPSPSQLAHQYHMAGMAKQQTVTPLSPKLMALLTMDPPIPRAIPAPSSPLKPLDRSLENKTGETNVYIRGLLPETADEMLHAWGKRFGDIQSSKSIIDLKTNLCKGFGFIKYHNFEDAENCIRGFHFLGYEVSFARESFYAKLKKFADESNTNLYVSNIPKNMNEHELGAIFAPHKVCSSRILRDIAGNGRGVGFARFETREICEEIIRKYNNSPVAKPGGEEHLIQIRYSDTHEQKMLKQQTAAGRVFRAAEYEVGVAQARAMVHPDRYLSLSPEQGAQNEFEMFLQAQHGSSPYMQPAGRFRAPWAPTVPSALGMSRPPLQPVAPNTVAVKVENENAPAGPDTDMKTPATPVKVDNPASPGDESIRED